MKHVTLAVRIAIPYSQFEQLLHAGKIAQVVGLAHRASPARVIPVHRPRDYILRTVTRIERAGARPFGPPFKKDDRAGRHCLAPHALWTARRY
jgi:hypothetical protein